MRSSRSAVLVALLGAALAAPSTAAAGGPPAPARLPGTGSQITQAAPARLTARRTATGPVSPRGDLPHTGYDLLPETVLGLVLASAGVGLRLRSLRA